MLEPQALERGLEALELDLPAEARERLLRYLTLLHKWNAAYNLTAVREPSEMMPRHLFDSLSIIPFVHGPRLMDAGTGAGLPGIPLSIALPRIDFILLDAAGKRMRFLHQVQAELGLTNVTLAHCRFEAYRGEPVHQVVSRAFTSLERFAELARPFLVPGGELLAMKATPPEAEIESLAGQYHISTFELAVPELEATRSLVRLVPNT